MTKHLIDTARPNLNSRLARFTEIARSASPHESTRNLIARTRTQSEHTNHRLAEYTRIARGKQA